jgi:hypothetical protein
LEKTYSSNKRWKNKVFFTFGDYKFAPLEVIESSKVLEETSIPSKTDQLKKTYSSNKRWKNKFFFTLGN